MSGQLRTIVVNLLPIILLLCLVGCGEKQFPQEYVGKWKSSEEHFLDYIKKSDLPDEEKHEKIKNYVQFEKDSIHEIDKNGKFVVKDLGYYNSDSQLSLYQKTEEGYIFQVDFKDAPSSYVLCEIKNDIWEIVPLKTDLSRNFDERIDYWVRVK